MSQELKFKISSALKNIIGKDLITDDSIAMFELVKNSYDARASKVIVTFDSDSIIIADNGKGMSYEDIINKWLFVAYSAKKDGTEDYRDKIQARRYYAGSKGVGRFSCDRLGATLCMYSKVDNSKTCSQLDVNWDKFDLDQKEEFATVPVKYQEISSSQIIFPDNKEHGTILKISNLNKIWNRPELLNLKHSLEKLINPFSENQQKFEIELSALTEQAEDKKEEKASNRERFIFNGIIKNSILEVLRLKTTKIYTIINDKEIITQLIDRGTEMYKIKEKNPFPLLTDLTINLFFLNRSAKHTFTTRMGVEPLNYGSIFLFKNGFRVQPYGTPADDSWELDYRAQQGRARYLGTRDLFGSVELLSSNGKEFKETSSRDGGLVKTDGYRQLIEAFTDTHRKLERYVAGVLWGEGFLKRAYFENEDVMKIERDNLQKMDSLSDNTKALENSFGSQLDFLQIIKNLVQNKKVEVLSYNQNLVNIVTDKMIQIKPKFISDLRILALKTDNPDLKNILSEAEEQVVDLQKENYSLNEEISNLQNQVTQTQQQLVRTQQENVKTKHDKYIVEEQSKYFKATRNITQEVADVLHSIKISSSELSTATQNIRNFIANMSNNDNIMKEVDYLLFNIERIEKLSSLLTKADIKFLGMPTKIDIPQYIIDYLSNYTVSLADISFKNNLETPFYKIIEPLDLTVILDNLINNSKKAQANKILIEFTEINAKLHIDFSDNGIGVPEEMIETLFKLGISSTRGGSGIGLNMIKETLNNNFFGDIEFLGNNINLIGATFRLIL